MQDKVIPLRQGRLILLSRYYFYPQVDVGVSLRRSSSILPSRTRRLAHLLVRVESVDDKRQKLVDVSRESEGLRLYRWGRLGSRHVCFAEDTG